MYKKTIKIVGLISIFYFIFSFYFWTISYGHSIHLDKKNSCYYNLLSEGFLSGMLNLSVSPSAELLNLPNPYDPIQNASYRLHDASLYKGKYYLYFGPTPALVLYIPCMLITGSYLRDHVAILIFSFLSLFWILGILLYLKEKYFREISYLMILFALLVVAFSDVAIYNLRRPHIYEVAISCAMFFLSGAIYLLCKAFSENENKSKNIMLLFASIFIGLSVGARPHFVFMGSLLLIAAYKIYNTKVEARSKIISIISLLIPYLVIVACICVYNYMRFDSPFQFGNKYQLAGMDINQYKILNINSLLPGLYLYLFSPLIVNSNFPFFHLSTAEIIQTSAVFSYLKPKIPYFVEKISGVFSFIPITFFCMLFFVLIPLLAKIKLIKLEKLIFPKYELLIIFLPGLINLLFISTTNGVTHRYVQDFAIYFLMTTIILWFYLYSTINNFFIKKFFNSFIFFVGVLSIVFGMSLSVIGCYDGLKEQNPQEFDKLSSEYSFLSEIIHSVAPLWGEF